MKYRTAAVAGMFYPAASEQLETELCQYLSSQTRADIQIHALIVPHAGYCYSGAVAGGAYAYIKSIAANIKRVVLLGPSHYVALQGCGICNYTHFSTPLGVIPVATDDNRKLLNARLVHVENAAHLLEHSLEVQLPFLQYCLHDFEILPMVVGICQPQLINDILTELQVNTSSTLVIISSDLSHYHPYREAQRLDNKTLHKILDYNTQLSDFDACGCYAVNGLLAYAKGQSWRIKLINNANSADTLGDKKKVVGYASFILY